MPESNRGVGEQEAFVMIFCLFVDGRGRAESETTSTRAFISSTHRAPLSSSHIEARSPYSVSLFWDENDAYDDICALFCHICHGLERARAVDSSTFCRFFRGWNGVCDALPRWISLMPGHARWEWRQRARVKRSLSEPSPWRGAVRDAWVKESDSVL